MDSFTSVWRMYNGSTRLVGKHLHMCPATVKTKATTLGLQRYKYLSIRQAAAVIGISSSQVCRYLHSGKLEGQRMHPKGRWLITKAACLELRAQLVEPQSGVSTAEAAKLLGYHPQSIRRMCANGQLQHYRDTNNNIRVILL